MSNFIGFLPLDISLLCDLQTSKGRFRKAGLDKLASHTARYALHEIVSQVIHFLLYRGVFDSSHKGQALSHPLMSGSFTLGDSGIKEPTAPTPQLDLQ